MELSARADHLLVRRPSTESRRQQRLTHDPSARLQSVAWIILQKPVSSIRQRLPSASSGLFRPNPGTPRSARRIRQSAVGLVPHLSGLHIRQSVDDISSGLHPTSVNQQWVSSHIILLNTFGVFWRFRAHLLSLYISDTPFGGCACFGQGMRLFTSVYISLAHMHGGGDL
ncbi:hypothetical protein ACLOJK_036132 [Asimina triloba]